MNGRRDVSAPIDEYSTGFPTQGDNQATTHQTAEFTPPPDSVHNWSRFPALGTNPHLCAITEGLQPVH